MQTKKTTLLLLNILEKIIANQSLHSLWLNTLSYLEYIGLRKMLKSLPASLLDKILLDHINEEARHSLFFKKLAQKTAQKNLSFRDEELLAPQTGRAYFQQVDHYSLKFFSNPAVNYLYTTYAIEQRAVILYSLYNDLLKKKACFFSLQAVLNDESKHLDFVLQKIQETDPLWEKNLEDIAHFEHQKYFSFLIDLEKAISDTPLMSDFPSLQKETHSSYHQKI